MNRKIKGVIWDLDGTLIDSDLYLVANYLHMYAKFRPGYYPHLREILSFSGPSVKQTLSEQFPDVDEKVRMDECVSFSLRREPEYLTLYKGERECLQAISDSGVKQCVLTNKKRLSALNCLKSMDIYRYMDGLVSLDDVKNPKPDPEGVYKCLDLLRTEREETIVIGDSWTDLQVALNSGCLGGLVTWSLKGLPRTKRDYEFDTMDDIRRLIADGRE